MADDIFAGDNPLLERLPEERGDPTWGDYGTLVKSSFANTLSGLGALADYTSDGVAGKETRDFFKSYADFYTRELTPEARERLQSTYLPEEGKRSAWDNFFSTLALKATASSAPLVLSAGASLLAGPLGGGAALAAGSGTAGLLNASDLVNELYEAVETKSDAELQSVNPGYAAYRAIMSEEDARRAFREDIIGDKPAIAAAISALTARFGIEGALARGVAGQAVRGRLANAGAVALGEAANEAIEEGSNAVMAGLALEEGKIGQLDPYSVANRALEGAVVGGALGGVTGLATGKRRDARTPAEATIPVVEGPDEAQAAALAAQTQPAQTQPTAQSPAQTEAPPADTPATIPAAPPANSASDLQGSLGSMGGAISQTLYDAVYKALADGKSTVAGVKDPLLEKARPAYEAGLIKSPEDLRRMANDGFPDPVAAQMQAGAQALEDAPRTAQAPAGNVNAPPAAAPAGTAAMQEGVQAIDDETQNTPEPLPTLRAQLQDLLAGKRPAMMFPSFRDTDGKVRQVNKGFLTKVLQGKSLPKGIRPVPTQQGIFWVREDANLTDQKVKELAKTDDGRAQLLGHETSKTDAAQAAAASGTEPYAVAAVTPEGVERVSAVTAAPIEAQTVAGVAKQASPGDTILPLPTDDIVEAREQQMQAGVDVLGEQPAPAPVTPAVKPVAPAPQQTTEDEAKRKFADNTARLNRALSNIVADQLFRKHVLPAPNIEPGRASDRAALFKRLDEMVQEFRAYQKLIGNPEKRKALFADPANAGVLEQLKQLMTSYGAKRDWRKILNESKKVRIAPVSKAQDETVEGPLFYLDMAVKLDTLVKETNGNVGIDVVSRFISDEFSIRAGMGQDVKDARKGAQRTEGAPSEESGGDDGIEAVADVSAEGRFDEALKREIDAQIADLVAQNKATLAEILSLQEQVKTLDGEARQEMQARISELIKQVMPAKARIEELRKQQAESIYAAVRDGAPTPSVKVRRFADDELSAIREESLAQDMLVTPDGDAIAALETRTLAELLAKARKDRPPRGPLSHVLTPVIMKAVEKAAGNTKVVIVDEADVTAMSGGDRSVKAFYARYGDTDVIVLPATALYDPNALLYYTLHEGVHAATARGIMSDSKFAQQIQKIATIAKSALADVPLRDVNKQADEGETFNTAYGFTNELEFIAEALSNPMFQAALAKVKLSEADAAELGINAETVKNLWGGVIELIRRFLNLPAKTFTVLEAALKVSADAMRAQAQLPDSFRPAGLAAATKVDAAKAVAGKAVKAVTPTSSGARALALTLQTLDQIRQQYRKVFVNEKGEDLIEKLVERIQNITPYADELREASETLTQRYLDLVAQDRKGAQVFAEVANAVTMLDAQLYGPNKHFYTTKGKTKRGYIQAEALLPGLRAKMDAVTQANPEARQLYEDMVEFFRDTQNTATRKAVINILRTHQTTLDEKKIDEITTAVMNGKLSDAQKEALGNPQLAAALEDAEMLRVIDGDYFPLMRHGDFVVQTRDSIGDLMGGKEVEPGVVEFRAATDAEALKMATAFARRKTKGKGFTEEDGVPIVLSPPTKKELPLTDSDFAYRVKVQLDGVHMFETQAEAEDFIRAEKRNYARISAEPLVKRQDGGFGKDLTNSQLSAIMSSLKKALPDKEDAGKLSQLETILHQAAVRQMAGNRVQKRSLPRRKFSGASEDLARNMLVYGEASTRYIAKLTYMPEIREYMSEIEELEKAQRGTEGEQMRGQVLEELRKRLDRNVVNVNEGPAWVRDLMTLSYIDKLFSPAYSLINAMQTVMVTFPVLAARFGPMQAGRLVADAYGDVGGLSVVKGGAFNTFQALKNFRRVAIDPTDVLGSIRKNLAKADDAFDLNKLLDVMLERGALNKNAGMEIAEAVSSGRGAWGMALSKVDRVARQMPAAIEQMNRAVTGVAAYRAAIAEGKTHDQAVLYAFDTVQNTQGDYSASNAPAIFNHPIWKVSLQFKKYAQMYYSLFGNSLYRAFKEADPKERRVAQKELAYLVAVQMLGAGALGIPGMEVVKLGFMAAAALGLGGGYDDWERMVRKAAADMFGKHAGELLTKGLIRQTGIDISNRIGADSMLTFGEPKKYEETDVMAYMFQTFGGAPVSLIVDQFKAARLFADGEFDKAGALLPLPKFITDTAKAAGRFIEEPTSAKTGRKTDETIGLGTAAINALGLRTAEQAERSAAKGAQIAQATDRREDSQRLSKLKNQYVEAKNEGERMRVWAQIQKRNQSLPADERLSFADLKKFAKREDKAKAEGLRVDGARYRNATELERARQAASPYNTGR